MKNILAPVNLIKIENKRVLLNSNLDEMMFGKTKFSLLLEEPGIIAEKDSDGKWTIFSEWKFDEIRTIDEKVFFCGDFSGNSLLRIIEEKGAESSEAENALFSVCEIYVNAIKQNASLPCNGAAGIIVDSEKEKILFVPEKTFDRSTANLGKTLYNYFQNDWRDSILTGNSALSFALGTMAYFSASKILPYSEENDKKISDRNFIPLEFQVNGINRKLADSVDSLLKGKILKNFPLEELKKQIFENENEKHKISGPEFEKKSEKFKIEQASRLKRQRFVRRNSAIAAAIFCAAVFIAVAAVSIAGENSKKPTAIGLDSKQVTEVFYRGIHTMDTDLMLCAAKDCPEAQRYISKVPQIYVTTQMKSAYNFDSGISTPENWFFFEPDSTKSYSHYIYGITNFFIDGESSALDKKPPTRKNHPPRKVYSEDGSKTRIKKMPDATHKVKYFLVHNQDNLIEVEEFTTYVNLHFSGKAWTITKLNQTSSSEYFMPLQVSLDFKQALLEHNNNEIEAVESLREKYPWLPTEKSMRLEKERLDKIGY